MIRHNCIGMVEGELAEHGTQSILFGLKVLARTMARKEASRNVLGARVVAQW